MREYYLVAEKDYVNGGYTVFVSGDPRGRIELMKVEAENFAAASKMFSFHASGMGRSAYCGVSKNGEPYAGKA